MPNISYNFKNNYDNLSLVTVPLCVVNYTNAYTLTCFCGGIDTVRCYPDFSNLPSQLNFIENWGYYIDFGDGTIVNTLTGTHNYKAPGNYQVTLIVTDSANNLFKSAFQPIIEAYNVIPDKVYIRPLSGSTVYSSSLSTVLGIQRFNSFQTYNSLSSVGYVINLSVSGNRSVFETPQTYEKDKYAHLKLFSAFSLPTDFAPITQVKTTCDMIYGQINPLTNELMLIPSPTQGIDGVNTYLLGTSGVATVIYYEDFQS